MTSALPSISGNRVSYLDEGSKETINSSPGQHRRVAKGIHKGLAIAAVMKVNQSDIVSMNDINRDNSSTGQNKLILPPI